MLFADISGSTPLAERLDPEEMRGILSRYFTALAREIQQFGGTIDKYIGDAVMAVFGAPASHEDDPIRAVGAALAMQEAIRRENDELEKQYGVALSLRIGINTGEVVAGLLAGEVQHAYTVVGDSVNTAQRLESVAAPNTIYASEGTYLTARRAFRFEALPPVTLKGKAEPLPAYRVLHRERRAAPREGPKLVGRGAELERLYGFLRQGAQGAGQVVHIHGDAGVGKSRLVGEFLATLTNVDRLRARCLAFESAKPYASIADLLRRTFHINPTDAEVIAREGLIAGITPLQIPAQAGAVSLCVEILGFGERSPLDPQRKRQLVVSLLRQLLRHRADVNPMVLVVEDVHWIDPASASVLTEALSEAARLRGLVITTSREPAPIFTSAVPMPLEPLPADAAEAMVELLGGGGLEPEVRSLVLERTAGNPFFIEEVLRTIRAGVSATVPATVQDLLEARLDALPIGVRHVAQRAAVIGRTFRGRVLAAISGEEPVGPALARLEAEAFILPAGNGAEPRYVFRHALLQEVSYQTLLLAQRRRLHGAVGAAVEHLYAGRLDEFVDVLAYHYRRSDEAGRAVPYLLGAGDRARALYANQEALRYYSEALVLAKESAARVAALEGLGGLYLLIGKFDEALSSFRAARAEVGADSRQRARLHRKVATVFARKALYHEALAELVQGMVGLGDDLDIEAARTYVRMGEIHSRSGSYEYAREALTRAVQLAERLEADDTLAEGLKYLGATLNYTGDLNGALALYSRCLAIYERLGDLPGTAAVRNGVGLLWQRMARWDEALVEFQSALSIEERIGDPWAAGICQSNIGEVHSSRGDFESAITAKEQAFETFTKIGAELEATVALMGIGNARVRLGQVARGRADLAEAEQRTIALGHSRYLPDLYRHVAYAELAAGSLDAADEAARRSLEYARAGNAVSQEAMTQRCLGEIALARGDKNAGRAMLEASRERLRELGELSELALTDAVLARLVAQRPVNTAPGRPSA